MPPRASLGDALHWRRRVSGDRGLDNLTIRPLDSSLPPDELWVNITYRTKDGEVATHRQDWLVYEAGEIEIPSYASTNSSKKRAAIDIKKTRINEVKRKLYGPDETPVRQLQTPDGLKTTLYAEIRRIDGEEFGYIRLFSFDVDDPEKFIEEFISLVTSKDFPQEGLIIDVRGNGGGERTAFEHLLERLDEQRVVVVIADVRRHHRAGGHEGVADAAHQAIRVMRRQPMMAVLDPHHRDVVAHGGPLSLLSCGLRGGGTLTRSPAGTEAVSRRFRP